MKGPGNQCEQMEFLNINLTKDSRLLLQAMHIACYWRILKKTRLFSGFKKSFKKSANREHLSLFMNGNEESQTKTRV